MAITLGRSSTFEVVLKNEAEKKPNVLTLDQQKDFFREASEMRHDWRYVGRLDFSRGAFG